jgi:hypothetical protein
MTVREQKGLEIAALFQITQVRGIWFVPSMSVRSKKYPVYMDNPPRCTCPDFETRNEKCKHIYAVEFTMSRESTIEFQDGQTTVTETFTETKKITYPQNWRAYNAAQTNEKRLFAELLSGLCSGVESPEYTFGRPRLPLGEQIFCAVYKVYSTVSSRRFSCDLSDAHERGYISKTPHFNSVLNVFDDEAVTPILQDLIRRSSQPLAALENDFAIDSTGFGSSRFEKWFDVKHGGMVSKREWVKCHAMVGVVTNVIASVEITPPSGQDTNLFPPLLADTASRFTIRELSADKAYCSAKNYELADSIGVTAFIPFKSNATGKRVNFGSEKAREVWQKMFHYYSLRKDEFFAHYHKRSNSESAFSMIKAKFGDSMRSKNKTAQTNEALCKVLAHNICVLIQSMHEFGIDPTAGFLPQMANCL